MISVTADHIVLLCLAGLLCWAVVSDATTLKIPNRVSIGVVCLYPAWVVANWYQVDGLWSPLALAAGVLVVGFLAFDRGLIGGGDAKLLAALSLWSGPDLFMPMIAVMTAAGGVIAVGIILAEGLRRRSVMARGDELDEGPFFRTVLKLRMPYGIAIALGGGVVIAGLWAG